jgi:hypothetical protein
MSHSLESLYAEIGTFLGGCGCRPAQPDPGPDGSLVFWRDHPSITAQEITMLVTLTRRPVRAEIAAQLLGRTCTATQEFLDALVAIGVLDHWGDHYHASAATERYLQDYSDRPTG